MNKLKVFTAFSGYDSQCMALDRLGIDYELVGWSEIDKYAIQAHNAVYPQYSDRNFGDISKIDWNNVPYFDLFTYSFPCQDISNAGIQKGLEEGSGTRSSLLWECKKTIEIKRPKYLVMENVKALTQKKFLPFLHKWQELLESYGYVNHTEVLNSKNYGIPQNRERCFMISILGNEDYKFPKPFELKLRLKDVLEKYVDGKYYLKRAITDRLLIFPPNRLNNNEIEVVGTVAANPKDDDGNIKYDKSTRGWVYNPEKIIATISATDYKQPKQIIEPQVINPLKGISGKSWQYEQQVYDANGIARAVKSGEGSGNIPKVLEPKIIQVGNLVDKQGFNNPQRGRVYDPNGIFPVIDTMCGGNLQPKVVIPYEDYNGKIPNDIDVIGTVVPQFSRNAPRNGYKIIEYRGQEYHEGEGLYLHNSKQIRGLKDVSRCLKATKFDTAVVENYRIRKLTPRECFRLMGVSEENIDKIQNAGISNSQQYKMAGNSIVVDVLYYIFKELFYGEKKAIKKEPKQLSLF